MKTRRGTTLPLPLPATLVAATKIMSTKLCTLTLGILKSKSRITTENVLSSASSKSRRFEIMFLHLGMPLSMAYVGIIFSHFTLATHIGARAHTDFPLKSLKWNNWMRSYLVRVRIEKLMTSMVSLRKVLCALCFMATPSPVHHSDRMENYCKAN